MAIPPVVIEFMARGVPDISRAMQSVSSIIANGGKATTNEIGAQERMRQRLVEASAKEQIRSYQAADRAVSAAQRAGLREAEAVARAELRAYQTTANEKIRIAQTVAREERRLQMEIARGAGSPGSAAVAGARQRLGILQGSRGGSVADQRAALGQIGALHIEHTTAAAEERSAAKHLALAERTADEEKRIAAKAATDISRANEKADRDTFQRREKFANALAGAGKQAIANTVKGGVALVGMATQLGGGFSVQGAMAEKLDLEKQAAVLSNTTNTGEGTRVSKEQILATVRATSRSTNMDESQLVGGLSAFVDKTGNYNLGAKNLDFFAKVAKSTGASMEDVSKTAGVLAVQNKNLSPDDLKQLTLSTVMSSRKGSVGYSDMAQVGGKITRSAVGYVGNQADLQAELMGLSQIGMRTEGNSVAAAATDISNIQGDAMKHHDTMRQLLGHEFMNKQGQIIGGPSQFIADVMQASGGDLSKVAKAGIGKSAFKTFQAIAPTFNDAKAEALKSGASEKDANKSAAAAVLADIKEMTAGKYDEKDLESDFAQVMQSSSEKFEEAVRLMKEEVADRLVPAMIPLVDALREAVPSIGKVMDAFIGLVNWIEKNPMEAAVAGLGVALTKAAVTEFASAKLGEVIKNMLQGGGGGVPGAPGGGGGGGGTGAGDMALLGGAVALQVGSIANLGDERLGAVRAGDAQAKQLQADLASGDPEKVKAAMAKVQELRGSGKNSKLRKAEAYGDTATRSLGILMNPLMYPIQKGTDAIVKRLGHQSAAEKSVETLTSDALLSSTAFQSNDSVDGSGGGGDGSKLDAALKAHGEKLDKLGEKIDKNTNATEKNSTATGDDSSPPPGHSSEHRTHPMAGRAKKGMGGVL